MYCPWYKHVSVERDVMFKLRKMNVVHWNSQACYMDLFCPNDNRIASSVRQAQERKYSHMHMPNK